MNLKMKYLRIILTVCSLSVAVVATACCSKENKHKTDPNPNPEPGKEIVINGTTVSADNNFYGLVKDTKGKGIEGVVVTEGYKCVKTDKNGVYQFKGDAVHARNVYISVPAEYKVPLDPATHYPRFYSENTIYGDKTNRNDFTLEAHAVQDKFTFVMVGDPQCKTDSDVQRYKNETIKDIQATINAGRTEGKYQNVYAMTLGDITFDNTIQWDPMVNTMKNVSISGNEYLPFFQTIGNHDHDAAEVTDYASVNNYVKRFGPTDYSFNIGKAHVVVMDNVVGVRSKGNTWEYEGGFSSSQYQWLKQDLNLVDNKEEKLIIFCSHIPFRNGAASGGASVNTDKYYSAVLTLLQNFKEAHLMIGHTHYNQNFVHTARKAKAGMPIYEHIHGAACGAWWTCNSNVTGGPNGYTIYEIEGASIKNWLMKGTNRPLDYQMRVYDGNQLFSGTAGYELYWYKPSQKAGKGQFNVLGNAVFKNAFVAEIFDDDDLYWTVELYQNGTKVGTFQKVANGHSCNVAVSGFYFNEKGKNTATWASKTASHYWYCAAPSGKPSEEKNWEVVATQKIPSSGEVNIYRRSDLTSNYSEF